MDLLEKMPKFYQLGLHTVNIDSGSLKCLTIKNYYILFRFTYELMTLCGQYCQNLDQAQRIYILVQPMGLRARDHGCQSTDLVLGFWILWRL